MLEFGGMTLVDCTQLMTSRRTWLRFSCALGWLGGICSCTALLGDFTVDPTSGDSGTTPTVDAGEDVVADVAADVPLDARPVGLFGVKEVVGGARHTCALDGKGDVYCWGTNNDGQLAQPASVGGSPKPVKVSLPAAAKAISAGSFHTCVLTMASEIYCWGRNDCGQIGAGDMLSPSIEPRKAMSAFQWATLAAGSDHTCAVELGGQAYCWGCNQRSQSGFASTNPVATPTNAGGDKVGFVALAASTMHSCGARAMPNGVACWGTEENGALGNGPPAAETHAVSVGVPLPTQVSALAAGEKHSCALDANNNIVCWGDNGRGQLGLVLDGGALSTDAPAGRIPGNGYRAVSANGATTCMIGQQGNGVFCVGANGSGQLGRGGPPDSAPHAAPQPVSSPMGSGPLVASAIGVGREHACAVVGAAGEVVCWGNGGDGQIGDGNTGGPPRTVPVPVVAP